MSLKNNLSFSLFLFILFCFFNGLFIVCYGLNDNSRSADVGIIFGNKAYRHNQPSRGLTARLNKGIQLYHQGDVKYLIVTGGTERNGVNEANVMKYYLMVHKIPASVIYVDSKSSNTWQNVINSKKIMDRNHFSSAIAISQYFHLARCVLIMKYFGISPIYHAHADIFEWRDLYNIPREVLAIYYYLVFHTHHTL